MKNDHQSNKELPNNISQHKRPTIMIQGTMISHYVPPQMLNQYKDKKKSDAIFNDNLQDIKHHRCIEDKEVIAHIENSKNMIKQNKLGLIMAFVITILMIIVTAILILCGHYIYGALSGGAFIACLSRFTPNKDNRKTK